MRWSLVLLAGLSSCKSPEKAPLPAASVAPAASTAAASPPATFTMFRLLSAKDQVRVHDVGGAPMVTAGAIVMRLGDAVSQDPAFGEGLEGNAEPVRVEGEFPDATFLTVALTHRVTGASLGERAYRWYAKRWAPAPSPLHDNPPFSIAEHGAATVALLPVPGGGMKLEVARAKEVVALPSLPAASDGCPSPFVLPRVSLVDVSGALAIVGERCDGRRAVITRLGATPSEASETPLPAGFHISAVRGRGASLFVAGEQAGKGVLLRFDGTVVSRAETPLDGPLSALAIGGDGSLWIASERRVAVRAADGRWSVAELPGPVTSVVATDASHAWAAAESPDGPSLFGLVAPKEVIVVPEKRASFVARGQHGKSLATAACTSLWVPLVVAGKAGWVPDDLPWLRESVAAKPGLEGIRYLAEDDGRETWIGALVPNLGAGERLVAELGERIGIGGQRVTCHAPNSVATFVDGRRQKRK